MCWVLFRRLNVYDVSIYIDFSIRQNFFLGYLDKLIFSLTLLFLPGNARMSDVYEEYSRVPVQRSPIYHHITYGTAITATERKSDFILTTDTPYGYLALLGELWGVYYENFEENGSHYNSTALYMKCTHWFVVSCFAVVITLMAKCKSEWPRAAYRYSFFDIDIGIAFWYRYQFDPYRNIHITILPRERPF